MIFDLILKQARAFLPKPSQPSEIIEEEVNIGIKDGYIQEIGLSAQAKARETLNLKGLDVLPGLIDTQVHFREPGLEYKEDIAHGSLSAVKGGITAFCEMPNTKPPTMSKERLEEKVQIAEKTSWCDFGFYMGTGEKNRNILAEIRKTRGCCGAKIFMGKSTGDMVVEEQDLLEQIISEASFGVTAIHSEHEARLEERKHLRVKQPISVHNHLLWRDDETAFLSTKRACEIAKRFKKPIHILHISSKQELDYIRDYRQYVSTELTPQHLTLSAPECYDKLGTLAQMNPPIRTEEHRQALWKALREGLIDVIGSDHAPHTLEEKLEKYPNSPSGMPGVQTLLPLMLNHVHEQRLDMPTLVKLLSLNPARLFRMKDQGKIAKGQKAHFTLVDKKRKKKIESSWLASKCNWSPFVDYPVTGWPVGTLMYGKFVVREDEPIERPQSMPLSLNF